MKIVISDVLQRAVWQRKRTVNVVNGEKFNFEIYEKNHKRRNILAPKLKFLTQLKLSFRKSKLFPNTTTTDQIKRK